MKDHIKDCQLGQNWLDCPACVEHFNLTCTPKEVMIVPDTIVNDHGEVIGCESELQKSDLFSKDGADYIWEAMEDFLQEHEVFKNGLNARPCHSDSYMTIVDFKALNKALDELDKKWKLTLDDWSATLRYWNENPNIQPPLRLVAATIERRYESKSNRK